MREIWRDTLLFTVMLIAWVFFVIWVVVPVLMWALLHPIIRWTP
jgi:hypothetical protein